MLYKINLLIFGWGNYAVNLMFSVTEDGNDAKEFEKLFKAEESDCRTYD
jgi:hypothetical protein